MQKTLISAAVAAALVTGLVVGLHSIRDIDPILEANVEALTNGESGGAITTWNCSGSPIKVCSASCGKCGTVVLGKGTLTGMHKCN